MYESKIDQLLDIGEFFSTNSFVLISFFLIVIMIAFGSFCLLDYNTEFLDQRKQIMTEFEGVVSVMQGQGKKKSRYKLFDGLTKNVLQQLEEQHRRDFGRREMILNYINRIEIKQRIQRLEKEFGVDKNKNQQQIDKFSELLEKEEEIKREKEKKRKKHRDTAKQNNLTLEQTEEDLQDLIDSRKDNNQAVDQDLERKLYFNTGEDLEQEKRRLVQIVIDYDTRKLEDFDIAGNMNKDENDGSQNSILKYAGDFKFLIFSIFLNSNPLYELFSLHVSKSAPRILLAQQYILSHLVFANFIPLLISIYQTPSASQIATQSDQSLNIPQAIMLFFSCILPFICHLIGNAIAFLINLFLPETPVTFSSIKLLSKVNSKQRAVLKADYFKQFYLLIFVTVMINLGLVFGLFYNSLRLTPEANTASASIISYGIAAGCLLVEGLGYFSLTSYCFISLLVYRRDVKSRAKQILTRFVPTAVAMDFVLMMKWKRKIGTKEDEEREQQRELLKIDSEQLPEEFRQKNSPEQPRSKGLQKDDAKTGK